MRCNNCGWNNPEGTNRCEKCNAPLSGSMVQEPSNSPQGNNNAKENISETVQGKKAEGSYIDEDTKERETADEKDMKKCPECGYPVLDTYETCPNCKTPLKKSGEQNSKNCPKCGEILNTDANFCSACGYSFKRHNETAEGNGKQKAKDQPNPQETVMWAPGTETGGFTLERITYTEEKTEEELVFNKNANETGLNRDNLDPGNNTITSKQQAKIEFSNGQWYITDTSSLKTTFLRAGEPTPIKDGDIIVMGNKKFRFKTSR